MLHTFTSSSLGTGTFLLYYLEQAPVDFLTSLFHYC